MHPMDTAAVRAIFQDRMDNLWFANNGNGVCRKTNNETICLTKSNGLCSNSIWNIVEDRAGQLWFGTYDGICRYDGHNFAKVIDAQGLCTTQISSSLIDRQGHLWFGNPTGVCRYDGKTLAKFPLDATNTEGQGVHSPYSVYSMLEDRAGNLWFGTSSHGIARYDGTSWTWFQENGLSEGPIRSIAEDQRGHQWFGHFTHGVYRYNGTSMVNFSEENALRADAIGLAGTTENLNRIWKILADRHGHLWFGTIDGGVWRYNGNALVHLTTTDGLCSQTISTISQDRSGVLWFGSEDAGACGYDGQRFFKVALGLP